MGRNARRIILLSTIGLIVGVSAYYYSRLGSEVTEVQLGRVLLVDELVAKVTANGEIKPKEYVELQSEISGVITQLLVTDGDLVEKGDILLRIDPTQNQSETRAREALLQAATMESANSLAQINLQEINVGRARFNLQAAEADFSKAEQGLLLKTASFKRQQELFEQNLISRNTYEVSKSEFIGAESEILAARARANQAKGALSAAKVILSQTHNSLRSAESRVEQHKAIMASARDTLSKTVIRSPLTGIITQLNVEAGERAVPGTLNNPAATIMIIADLSVIEAEVEVNETDIVAIKLDQTTVVQVDALPRSPLHGIVSEIGNSAIVARSSQAKEFRVAIQLDSPPAALRPGLSCTAEILTDRRSNVLTIPIQSLVIREYPIDENGQPIKSADARTINSDSLQEFTGVLAVTNDRVEFLPISIGIFGQTIVEVTSGLKEDMEIVTGPYKILRDLQDNDPVTVQRKNGGN